MRLLLALLLLSCLPAIADEGTDKAAVCLPVARALWAATVEVYDEKLADKPKYQAAKNDPSEVLLEMVEKMPDADQCAAALALYGPDGLKALMIKTSREDLAAGKYPRFFD